jgi:predicted transcriptional regulator
MAAAFTTGELAALRVVGDAVRMSGRCDKTIGEIAARAGVGETTARNALRLAAKLGLLTIEERRRRGKPNLPNLVRIVSAGWLHWLKRGGCKKTEATDKQSIYTSVPPQRFAKRSTPHGRRLHSP